MENKKHNFLKTDFGKNLELFKEARFIYEDNPPRRGLEDESRSERSSPAFDFEEPGAKRDPDATVEGAPRSPLEIAADKELYKGQDFLKKLDEELKKIDLTLSIASNNLRNNPFKKEILNIKESFKKEGKYDFSFTVKSHKPGELVLSYGEGTAKSDIVFDKHLYVAVFWDSISKKLNDLLKVEKKTEEADEDFGKRAEKLNEQIYKAIELKLPQTDKLVLLLAGSNSGDSESAQKIDKKTLDEAINELNSPSLEAEVKKDAAKKLAKMKSDMEKDRVGEGVKEKTKRELDGAFKIGPNAEEIKKQRIDEWIVNVNREAKKINADKWQPETADGLTQMRDDWVKLGIPATPGNGFYDKIFKQLSKSSDPAFLQTITDPKIKNMYLNPRNNLDELQKYDNAFYRSWQFYESVKKFVVDQDNFQKITTEKVKNADREPIADKAVEAVKDNLKKFQTAIRQRDYATAGVYVLGIWAMYKSYKSFAGGGDAHGGAHGGGGDFKKWLILGAAVFAADKFAKTAGWDIGKKLGLRDMEAEVMGTPLEALARLEIPEAKDIDYHIYLKSSEINVTSLHKFYEESNVNGIRWINPTKFPKEFPEFKTKIPSDREKDQDYKHAGEQLYLIIKCLELAYDKTLKIDEKLMEDGVDRYYKKDFKDVVYEDSTLSTSNVRQFTGVLLRYSPPKFEKAVFEPEALKQTSERFNTIFKPTDMAAWLEPLPLKESDKHFVGGKIMNFPIVVMVDAGAKRYRIFAKKDYLDKKEKVHEATELGSISFDGDATKEINDLRAEITKKMAVLIAPIQSSGGRILKAPEYNRGKWTSRMEIPGATRYKIATRPDATMEVIPLDDGTVSLKIDGMPATINVDYFMNQEFPHAGVLLANMVQTEEVAALRPFYNSGKIRFVGELTDNANGNPRFEIEVVGEKVAITFNPATDKFEIDPAAEQKLVENPRFKKEYSELLTGSQKLKEIFEKLQKLVDDAPEEFHFYLFKGLKGWFTGATLDSPLRGVGMDFVSGSLPDYYMYSVLEAKKISLQYSLEGRLMSAKKFADVRKAEIDVWGDAFSELDSLSDTLNKESNRLEVSGEKWKRDNFMLTIVEPLKRVGTKSNTYRFALEDFETYALAKFGLKGSDIFKDPHRSLAHLKGVYAFYTARLDGPDLDVKYPVPNLPANDPGLEPYYKVSYLKFVKEEIMRKGTAYKDNLPNPETWGIPEFETWKQLGKLNVEPLDLEDAKGAMEHNPGVTHAAGKLTELETYCMTEFKAMVEEIRGIDVPLGKVLATNKLNGWEKEFLLGKKGSAPQLYTSSNTIHSLYGTLRSRQIKAVKESVNSLRMFIVQHDDFWADVPILDRIRLLFK